MADSVAAQGEKLWLFDIRPAASVAASGRVVKQALSRDARAHRRRQMRWAHGAAPTRALAAPATAPPAAPGRATAASTCAGPQADRRAQAGSRHMASGQPLTPGRRRSSAAPYLFLHAPGHASCRPGSGSVVCGSSVRPNPCRMVRGAAAPAAALLCEALHPCHAPCS